MSLILPQISMALVLTRMYATVTHITVVISGVEDPGEGREAMFVMLKVDGGHERAHGRGDQAFSTCSCRVGGKLPGVLFCHRGRAWAHEILSPG